MTKIHHISLKLAARGFVVEVFPENESKAEGIYVGSSRETYAYSNLTDLIAGLRELLEPGAKPGAIGELGSVFRPKIITRDDIVRDAISTESLGRAFEAKSPASDDDGWREWDGELRGDALFPPGVKWDDTVDIIHRDGAALSEVTAGSFSWAHGGAHDIVRYRLSR